MGLPGCKFRSVKPEKDNLLGYILYPDSIATEVSVEPNFVT